MVDWTHVLVALIAALPAIIAAIRANQVANKLPVVEKKIEQNTKITASGSVAAAEAAIQASEKIDEVKKALNGGVDDAIQKALVPVIKTLTDHAVDDKKNMDEINLRFQALEKYLHERNHQMLNALGTISNNTQAVALEVKALKQEKK